jgi:hypothetical protein
MKNNTLKSIVKVKSIISGYASLTELVKIVEVNVPSIAGRIKILTKTKSNIDRVKPVVNAKVNSFIFCLFILT